MDPQLGTRESASPLSVANRPCEARARPQEDSCEILDPMVRRVNVSGEEKRYRKRVLPNMVQLGSQSATDSAYGAIVAADVRSPSSHANRRVAASAPAICASMKPGTSTARIPANVSVMDRATVTAGFANEVDAVNQYAATM